MTVDPDTGQTISADTPGGGGAAEVNAAPVAASRGGPDTLLTALTVLELAAAVSAPAVLGAWLRRRRKMAHEAEIAG